MKSSLSGQIRSANEIQNTATYFAKDPELASLDPNAGPAPPAPPKELENVPPPPKPGDLPKAEGLPKAGGVPKAGAAPKAAGAPNAGAPPKAGGLPKAGAPPKPGAGLPNEGPEPNVPASKTKGKNNYTFNLKPNYKY